VHRRARYLSVVVTCAVLAVGFATAADARTDTAAAGTASLTTDLNKILSDPRLAHSNAGVEVTSLRSGQALYSHDADHNFNPASNLKLLTSAAAFHILGAGYRFHTGVASTARVTGGVLNGNLYLEGGGDASMLASDYDNLAAAVAARTRVVRGGLVADDTWFDHQRLAPFWAWDDEPWYYQAGISALTVAPDTDYDAGAVYVDVAPGAAAGDPATVTVKPRTNAVTIDNQVTTGPAGSADTVSMLRRHASPVVDVTGSIPLGGDVYEDEPSVDDPTAEAADVFRQALARHGVAVLGRTTSGATPSGATQLAGHDSATLGTLAVPFLKLSNNMIAEILTKSIGRKLSGQGTWDAGLAGITAYEKSIGLDTSLLRATDGSGLSRADLVEPAQLTTLLAAVRSEPWFTTWYNALPIAGNPDRMVGGTLRHRMAGTPAANNVHAKTGSLTSVSALSGYVTDADGEPLAFSIMENNQLDEPITDIEDAIAVRLAEYSTTEATSDGAWSRQLEPGRARAPRLLPDGRDPAGLECSWTRRGC
jgi:D-alanyl-D-alanine carboxypeptidase/D-alanyl-D-alanine-endopeptidase (penicillin-binding protein 4)